MSQMLPPGAITPARAGGRGLADGCWGCFSVRKTGNEKSVPLSTADRSMTGSSLLVPKPGVLRELSHPRQRQHQSVFALLSRMQAAAASSWP